MVHEVFISYSHKDSQIAEALCTKLEDEDFKCWIATRDIEVGEKWANAIAQAIPESKAFIIILSSSSNASNQVLREIEIAIQNKIVVLPIRIEDIMPTGGMSYYLATMQWIDVKGKKIDSKMSEITIRIKSILDVLDINDTKGEAKKSESRKTDKYPIPKNEIKKTPKVIIRKLVIILSSIFLVIEAGTTLFLLRDRIFISDDNSIKTTTQTLKQLHHLLV